MKSIKYLIVWCAICICLLIIGESKVFYLSSFSDTFRYTTMYKPHQVDNQTMKEDVLKSAEEHNIEFFTVKSTPTDFNSIEYQIYGTDKAIDYIQKKFDIKEGVYGSLLLGNVSFNFQSFKNSKDTPLSTTYYIIGSKKQAKAFKINLIDKYAGNHPREGTGDISSLPVVATWILVAIVIILFTLYDIVSQRKENLVRVTMGERMSILIFKNIVSDLLVFSLFFIISYLILQLVSNPNYKIQVSIIAFILILFVNSILYLSLFKYNLKETFSNSRSSNVALVFNYILKIFSIIITTIVISSNIYIIYQSYIFYQQKDFFKERKNFSYVNINYELMDREKDGSINNQFHIEQERRTFYNHNFYRKFFKQSYASQITKSSSKINEIHMNKTMENYLKKLLPSLKSMTLTKDEYYFIPQRLKNSPYKDEINSSFFSGKEHDYSSEIIFYDEDIAVTAINTYDSSSSYVRNPIITFNNLSIQDEDFNLAEDLIAFPYNRIMYEVDDEDFKKFIKDNKLENQLVVKTNVWDNYLAQWKISKRLLYINTIFTLLVLVLEMLIITSIIRLEYQVNSLEIAIKKTLGYSLLKRNSKLILITLSVTLLGIIFSIVSAFVLEMKEWPYLLWGSVIIFVLELIVIIFLLKKADKENVPKILKGGNL
ncbi:DUF1430 domain-containing protein [Rummeliibacillus suwonensis]|uniref:DUF1430 domain-containing protein n=1 Tax=Rummeliibacillus suwonensis TaxID=1306154 RepID=UPI00289E0346|nr:DUF1430 domain-containing protein [Rummeliibacillus suwonensis]